MLSRRLLTAAARSARTARPTIQTRSYALGSISSTIKGYPAPKDDELRIDHRPDYREPGPLPEELDPDMNGGYINPPAIKRSNRDPYEDWDDKQERRNFGEPVHEDNDILGVFSLHDYTHMTSGRAALCWAFFISTVLGLSFAVKLTYPDRPSAPKEYEGGLDKEMGGPGSLRAWQAGDELK